MKEITLDSRNLAITGFFRNLLIRILAASGSLVHKKFRVILES